MKKLAISAFIVLIAAACSTSNKVVYQKAPVPKTFNLRVDVRLSGAASVRGNLEACVGIGPFSDIAPKTKVVVTNQIRQPIAVGYIAYGLGTDYFHSVLDECSFRIYVFGVPKAKSYTIAVGHHPAVPFTRAALLRTKGVFGYDLDRPNVALPSYPTTTTTKG